MRDGCSDNLPLGTQTVEMFDRNGTRSSMSEGFTERTIDAGDAEISRVTGGSGDPASLSDQKAMAEAKIAQLVSLFKPFPMRVRFSVCISLR